MVAYQYEFTDGICTGSIPDAKQPQKLRLQYLGSFIYNSHVKGFQPEKVSLGRQGGNRPHKDTATRNALLHFTTGRAAFQHIFNQMPAIRLVTG